MCRGTLLGGIAHDYNNDSVQLPGEVQFFPETHQKPFVAGLSRPGKGRGKGKMGKETKGKGQKERWEREGVCPTRNRSLVAPVRMVGNGRSEGGKGR